MEWLSKKGVALIAAASFIVGGAVSGVATHHIDKAKSACRMATEVSLNEQKVMGLLWMQTSAEYRALCYQAYGSASRSIDDAIEKRKTAKDGKPLAIVTDCDEAVLDNTPELAHHLWKENPRYGEVWAKWCDMARAEAMPGARDFLKSVEARGVEVFYVTNRGESTRDGTLANLKRLGFPNADDRHLLLRGETGDKSERFERVARDYDVILYMGDNAGDWALHTFGKNIKNRNAIIDDAAQDFGTKYIALPNPVYGAWDGALTDFKGGSPREVLERRRALVNVWDER
ncbi:MAG: 5'-nucleotidase, lipoprotein e(P4) family [Selenomonadaceae bacterium]